MASSSNTAFQTFNLANDIYELSPQDEIFKFDVEANRALNREAPWSKECAVRVVRLDSDYLSGNSEHYFKSCKISAVALIKMVRLSRPGLYCSIDFRRTLQVIHARSGVPHEIMGLMQGKVQGDSLVIMDSFALPVQGTETRVNAGNEAIEYMVQYTAESEKVHRAQDVSEFMT